MTHRIRSTQMRALVWLVLVTLLAGSQAQAADFWGVVVSAETQKPLEGVRVHLGDHAGGTLHSSKATDSKGQFRIEGLQASTFEVAIEHEGGAFLVDAPITVGETAGQPVRLVVNTQATQAANGSTLGGRGGAFDNPLIASLAVIGGALAVGLAIDSLSDEEDDATPQ